MSKNGRAKPNAIHPIGDLAAANAALGEIAGIKRSLGEVETAMNAAIDHAKATAEAEAAPLMARLKALEGGLQAFATLSKSALFEERKSLELTYGHLGFRRSTCLKPASRITWEMVLGQLRALGGAGIRTKEEVDKEALREWSDERLELVGVRRMETDAFWYETKSEEIQPAEAAAL